MENDILLLDVSDTVGQAVSIVQKSLIWDYICDVSMIIIAIVNVVLLIYTFHQGSSQENMHLEKNRRINLLNTLVIDYTMHYLYSFFDDIIKETERLQVEGVGDEIKQDIESKIQDHCRRFRMHFIDTLLAIDKSLYERILDQSDTLQGYLSNAIFDEGYNYSNQPKFDEIITNKISQIRTEMIRILFSYTGD